MADDSDQQRQTAKTRKTLLGLLLIFTLPIGAAFLLTLGPLDWYPQQMLNQGVLLETPLTLQGREIRTAAGNPVIWEAKPSEWLLLIVAAAGCVQACEELWSLTQQIHLALSRDAARVQRRVLLPESTNPVERVWVSPEVKQLASALALAAGSAGEEPVLCIVDHSGQLVLAYPPPYDGQGALRDLKRLLRASRAP